MKLFNLSLIVFLGIFGTIFPHPLAAEKPVIDSPVEGEVLRGVVTITGSTDILGFQSAELLFGYEGDPTETWFLIRDHTAVVKGGELGTWDTNQITDGNYKLLLRVYVEDGVTVETLITGLRIRNYMTVETSTPGPEVSETSTVDEITDSDVDSGVDPVEELADPAQVTLSSLFLSILKGMGYALLGLALIGAIFYLRNRYLNRA